MFLQPQSKVLSCRVYSEADKSVLQDGLRHVRLFRQEWFQQRPELPLLPRLLKARIRLWE